MKDNNFKHDAKDFVKALDLDKDVLLAYIEPEVKAYIKDNKALSNCILDTIAAIKKDNPKIKKENLEIMLFVTGMLFEQVVTTIQSKMSLMDSLFNPLLGSMLGSDIKSPSDVKSPLDLIKKLKDLKNIQESIQDKPTDGLIESFLHDKNDGSKGPATEFLESVIGRDKLDEIVKRSLKKAGLDIKDLGKILKGEDRPSETITQPFNTDDLIKSMQEDDE